MTIGLDSIIFTLQQQGGISVYWRELLGRLARDRADAVSLVDSGPEQPIPRFDGLREIVRPPRPLERIRRCRDVTEVDVHLFHSSYYRKPASRSVRSVVTVYDFIHERFIRGARGAVHAMQKAAAIRGADAVICISHATLAECQRWVGLRDDQIVKVIHLAASDDFRQVDVPPASRPFALFVGKRGGYKNFAAAVHAMEFLPDLELLCVGGEPFGDVELGSSPAAVRSRIRHVGAVPTATLNVLMNQAVCLLYPSRCEGFGIPVVEAMAAGCPVVATRCAAVLEVGKEAIMATEDDARAIAQGVRSLLDASTRASRVRRGLAVASTYSWERCYRETTDVYRALSR